MLDSVDLCSGIGGWSIAWAQFGVDDFGVELDPVAVSTARAAGFSVLETDMTKLDPEDFLFDALTASPPCQSFSAAGKGGGRDVTEYLGDLIGRALVGEYDHDTSVAEVFKVITPKYPDKDKRMHAATNSVLVVEPARWIRRAPEFVVMEQVPAVLPIWEKYAEHMRTMGYSVWTGTLNAADVGVPQTRKRAILIANLNCEVGRPKQTHAKEPIDGQRPWVSMAEALGWSEGRVGFPRLDDKGTSLDGYRDRDWRTTDEPAFALTEKARSWSREGASLNTGRDWKPGGTRADAQTIPTKKPSPAVTHQTGSWWLYPDARKNVTVRSADEPAATLTASMDNGDARWVWTEPATSVTSSSTISARKHNGHGDQSRGAKSSEDIRSGDYTDEPVKLTPEEALVLQSFPPNYPVQGSRTARFRQIGNAIPPLLAHAVIAEVLGCEVH